MRTISQGFAVLAVLAVLAAAGYAPDAAAQTSGQTGTSKLGDEMISCASIDDDEERLACYDGLAQPLAGLDDAANEEDGAGQALHSFAGEDDWQSEVFTMEEPWRITWQTQANILTIEVYGPEGELLDVVGNQIGAGGGSSGTLKPGRYSIAARGIGSWRLKVLPAEE
ncbi:MAG: hypothetical protein WD489_10600 [Rhodovibrionaceae bacterium]